MNSTPTTDDRRKRAMDDPTKDQSPALKELYGRLVNNTNETYRLPADVIEHSRLDLQHEAICLTLGGTFPRESGVHDVLSRTSADESPPRVLDVGTGSGSWAIAVAKAYPLAKVVGVDLAPVIPGSTPPENCRFVRGDAHSDLSALGRFDLIHVRAVLQGIKDFPAFFKSLSDALSPGGVLLVLEPQMQLYDEHKVPFGDEANPGYVWILKMFRAYVAATEKRNPGYKNLLNLRNTIETVEGEPWTSVEGEAFYLPVGRFPDDDPTEKVAGELTLQACLSAGRGIKPLLMLDGHAAGDVDRWSDLSEAQMKDPSTRYYMKWDAIWATKKAANV